LAFAAAMDSGSRDTPFETALLLTLRSKELGLPSSGWLEQARALMPTAPGWSDYLDVVTQVPMDPLSDDRDALLVEAVRHRRPRAVLEQWRRQLTAGPGSSVFRAYLDLSLACGPLLSDQRDLATAAVLETFGDVGSFAS
jgi:hypothetical protein